MEEGNGNPYFDKLFQTFKTYVSNDSLSGGSLHTADDVLYDKLSKFTPNEQADDGFINIAGNYKYTCVVPIEKNQPPNYVGVLKENDALSGSFIDELLSFIESDEEGRQHINCTRAADHLYTLGYRPVDSKTSFQGYLINFTDGMPYSIYEPALRTVHKDILKQLNNMIDYAISTGQTYQSASYDDVLVNNFLNIFFTADGKPRYYALRMGILPSAISYSRYLQAVEQKSSTSFANHYSAFEQELDTLTKGSHFIPIGQSTQFLNSYDKDDRLYWYPFNTKLPYSYKYITSDGTKDKERYEVVNGFNHYHLKGDEALKSAFTTVLDSTSIQTEAINTMLGGTERTTLSYESCLSDIPAPNVITVTDIYKSTETKDGKTCVKGNRTDQITNIEKWANVDKTNKISMHPLLNKSGKSLEYLKVVAEHNDSINEEISTDTITADLEELYYYNEGFEFQPESRALERMNYYSTDSKDKSVDVYSLEFGVVSRDLYDVANAGTDLMINKEIGVSDGAYGILGKLPEESNTWKTVTCGITEVYKDATTLLDADSKRYNYLFSLTTHDLHNKVDPVTMEITTLHYNDPYGGEGDKRHGCNYYRDDGFAWGYDCHRVYYLETVDDYHEWAYGRGRGEKDKDFELTPVKVDFEKNAVRGVYNQGAVYNMCNMVMNQESIQGYYYTIHILADDGKATTRLEINPSNGKPVFDGYNNDINVGVDGDKLSKDDRITRYGTGLQYFFGGNCDESIFKEYYDRGLTVYQLLDPNTDAYSDQKGKLYGRIINGVYVANRAFKWDYDVISKAWNLALWIMRGYPDGTDRTSYKSVALDKLYKTNNAAIALAAFFDYIYQTNEISLMLGPSLKQINNAVGPYGTNPKDNDGKGVSVNKEFDNTTLRGAAWDAIKNKKTGRRIYDELKEHAKAAAAVYVDSDSVLYKGSNTKINKSGVGIKYWSKGDVSETKYNDWSTTSEWGEHNADARRSCKHSEGYLHLDHFSWAWNMDRNADTVNMFSSLSRQNNLWHGAFMIHAKYNQYNNKTYNSPFNWHQGPFHEVSPEAKKHTNEYGVRNKLVRWLQKMEDGSERADAWNGPDADGGCWRGTDGDKAKWKQAWDGINELTYDNQNPNIRIRLPLLWRYLASLREKKIYTDGQLMPCGIELHYCNYRKAILTSITDAEHTIPITTGLVVPPDGKSLTADEQKNNNNISLKNLSNWQNAIKEPSSVTFAEVLYDTYAITRNTISDWYNVLKSSDYNRPLIRDILERVAAHGDKLTAMYRAKRYIDSIPNTVDIRKGKTLYNLPILPALSMFGASKPGEEEEETMEEDTAEEEDIVETKVKEETAIVMQSNMQMLYEIPPDFNLNAAKLNSIGTGITYPPTLQEGQKATQFTDISTGIYANMSNFDGDTIGWIVPIPTKSNLALLNAYDGSWRKNMPAVIHLTHQNLGTILETLSDNQLHWIGWVNSDTVTCLETSDLAGFVHICRNPTSKNSTIGADVVVVPMISVKIVPHYSHKTKCILDGSKCTQSEDDKKECENAKPFSVKLEIDTRGTYDSLKLIMIRDTIVDDVEYTIHNVTNSIDLKGNELSTYMTIVSYDKDSVVLPEVLHKISTT